MSKTPVTRAGLKQYDHLSPEDAVLKAWTDPGTNPGWHYAMKRDLHKSMPLLARALDRLAESQIVAKPPKPGATP